jgi:hypothetical protein
MAEVCGSGGSDVSRVGELSETGTVRTGPTNAERSRIKRTGLIYEAEADSLTSDTNEVERLLNGMIRRLNTNK